MDREETLPTATGKAVPRVKRKRSRFGCNTCRARKVKCDERPNSCANCEKLSLKCAGYNRPRTASKAGTGSRTFRSCNSCRVARTKCSGEKPSCSACRMNGFECSYEDVSNKSVSPSSHQWDDDQNSTSHSHAYPATSTLQATSVAHVNAIVEDSPLPWLRSSGLPEAKQIRLLVTYYFQNFHPLRCFSFIHPPTFLRILDDELASGLQQNPLLHIMCTLGAQYFALEYSDTVEVLHHSTILLAGREWAKTAERLLLEDLNQISIERLMVLSHGVLAKKVFVYINGAQTAQLLYDYALRMANFTQAFILSAMMTRMTQALQINLEFSADILGSSPHNVLSCTDREARRRLMWSCYITDVLCGSGVEQLTLIKEKDVKIQLPCNDYNFLHERPCVTKTLRGAPLSFIPPQLVPSQLDLDSNLGMLAYFVQQVELRQRVLTYIKRLSEANQPWLANSEFAALDAELRNWYDSLPPSLEFSSSAIYMRKETFQLGALCLFHCSYHQTMCDLYRIGTPGLYKLRSPFYFPPEQAEFQQHLQWTLFKEARTLAVIIAEGNRHGPRIISDTWLPTIAYDSNRIMLFYLTQITDTFGGSKKDLVMSTIPYLQSNLKALKSMMSTNVVADGLYRAAETMLEKLGVASNNIRALPNLILDDPYLNLLSRNRRSVPGTPPQTAPDYVLNPLSIYRMARNGIPERHAPESFEEGGPADTDQRKEPHTDLEVHRSFEAMENLDLNFDLFFLPDLDLDWQPADMVVSAGIDGDRMLPWTGETQLGDFISQTDPMRYI